MQQALYMLDGLVYTALQLAALGVKQRASFRGNLVCDSCRQPAFYRGPGKRLRTPCFFSRPHLLACEQRTGGDSLDDEEGDVVNRWEERENRLVILVRVADDEGDEVGGGEGHETESHPHNAGGGGSTKSINIQRGPQRVLEQLVNWDRFKTSSMICQLPDGSELPVHSAFVSFKDARPELHADKWLGFWGVVPGISYWKRGDSYYLNFGARSEGERIRVAITRIYVEEILRRYGLASVNELVGRYLLIFDDARVSNSGRFTADVNGPSYVGLMERTDH